MKWWKALVREFGVVLCLLLGSGPVAETIPPEAVRLATSGEYDAALEIFRLKLKGSPESPVFNYYVGICLYFTDERSDALPYLEKAVEKKAGFPQAYYWLGRLLLEKGEPERALRVAIEGQGKFPRHEKLSFLVSHLQAQGADLSLKPAPGP